MPTELKHEILINRAVDNDSVFYWFRTCLLCLACYGMPIQGTSLACHVARSWQAMQTGLSNRPGLQSLRDNDSCELYAALGPSAAAG